MFTHQQLTVIFIEFSLCTIVHVDCNNNVFIYVVCIGGILRNFSHLSVVWVKSDNDSTHTMITVIDKLQIYSVCRYVHCVYEEETLA